MRKAGFTLRISSLVKEVTAKMEKMRGEKKTKEIPPEKGKKKSRESGRGKKLLAKGWCPLRSEKQH